MAMAEVGSQGAGRRIARWSRRAQQSISSEEVVRLFILGATGGVGRELLRIGLERGHELTAYVRSPHKISRPGGRLAVVQGDLFRAGAMARFLAGHDAVLSAFGPATVRTTTLRHEFGRTLASALREGEVRRVQLVSAAFLFRKIGLLGAILKPTLFRFMAPDMAAMEREIMKEDLEWTVVRPPRLTDGPLTRGYRVADGELPASGYVISRADVADFMINEAETPAHAQRIVGLAR
jgi:putative NADH-flavin reductase